MAKITLDKIRESAKKIVAESGEDYIYEPLTVGEYVNPVCQYTSEGAPSCLVGHILLDLGIPVRTLVEFDRANIAAHRLHEYIDDIDYPMSTYLGILQRYQDYKHPWGEALDHAERMV